VARYVGSVCRLCRRETQKLFLKGSRCYTEKCAVERRNYPPGQHGQARQRPSEYRIQLREKQKLKRIYGVLETQFRGYFKKAVRKKGVTGDNLILFLERRLDSIVYRMGFCSSRQQARQMIIHGHFLVNGRKVNIPSSLVKTEDVIELKQRSREIAPILSSLEAAEGRGVPEWLQLDRENFKGTVKAYPTREELQIPVNDHLVVELYSR